MAILLPLILKQPNLISDLKIADISVLQDYASYGVPTDITFINIGEDNNEVVVEVSVQNHGIAVNYTVLGSFVWFHEGS